MTTDHPAWQMLDFVKEFQLVADADIRAASIKIAVEKAAEDVAGLERMRDQIFRGPSQFKFDYQTETRPVWRQWLPLPYWTAEEAAALSMDWTPAFAQMVLAACIEGLLPDSEATKDLQARTDWFRRHEEAEPAGKLTCARAMQIAYEHGWRIPNEFTLPRPVPVGDPSGSLAAAPPSSSTATSAHEIKQDGKIEQQATVSDIRLKFSVARAGQADAKKEWISVAVALANKIGLERWNRGVKEITVRNIIKAVAKALAEGEPGDPQKYHGTRGPRAAGSIRTHALKGWKFVEPSGTNGTNGAN